MAAPVVVSVKPAEQSPSSGRKAEASIMFSLEELMKQNTIATKREEAPEQLWKMESATPLFGTSHDQALLTTPMKIEPASSMDSMTLPSHPPRARRWLPFLAVAGVTVALVGTGLWMFGSPLHRDQVATVTPTTPVQAPPEEQPSAEVAPVQEPAAAEPAEVLPPAVIAAVSEAPANASEPAATAVRKPDAPTKDRVVSKKPPARAAAAPSIQVFPFNKGAAKEALNAAASQASGCRQGGPPGTGKIQVTFGTSGKVSSATIVEGPLGGTAAGKCALRHFRTAKVPAFAGAPVTVAKSFKVN